MQKAEAGIKSKVAALNQLNGSTETADESYQKLMRSMGFVDGFKWMSMADYARDMNRVSAAVDRQAESYSAKNTKHKRSNKSGSTNSTMPAPTQDYNNDTQRSVEIDRASDINNSNSNRSNVPSKTIEVNFKLGSHSVNAQVPENQENALMALLQQLQDSKAIAGY